MLQCFNFANLSKGSYPASRIFRSGNALSLSSETLGRGAIGKSAMVCRLLRSLEGSQRPDDGGPLTVDGIVYLSHARSYHRVSVPDLYAGLTKLLPEETVLHLDSVYKKPQVGTRETMQPFWFSESQHFDIGGDVQR